MAIFKYKLKQLSLGNSGENFTRYLAIKIYEDREFMLACSQVSGMLYIPNHEPTLFDDLKLLKNAIKKTREYMMKTNSEKEAKTSYIIYKLNFTRLDQK